MKIHRGIKKVHDVARLEKIEDISDFARIEQLRRSRYSDFKSKYEADDIEEIHDMELEDIRCCRSKILKKTMIL